MRCDDVFDRKQNIIKAFCVIAAETKSINAFFRNYEKCFSVFFFPSPSVPSNVRRSATTISRLPSINRPIPLICALLPFELAFEHRKPCLRSSAIL